MSSAVIFQCFLALHLIGFALFVGSIVTDFVAFRQFRKQYKQSIGEADAMLNVISKFPPVMAVGVLLAIVAGVGMMTMVHGVYGDQVWLRIKVPLVLIAALNGIIVRRKQGGRLMKVMSGNGTDRIAAIKKICANLNIFYTVQFILCFAIVLLSAFKFH
ncbi:hypothetical protein ACTHGU_19985 [Chitinophagaceae bacterium MMS25-I14]